MNLQTFDHQRAWLTALIADFNAVVRRAIEERGVAHVALSGGNTPKPFYAALNGQSSLPWDKIGWWLGDERHVPPTDAASNEKMVRESLGVNQPLFDKNFQSWHTSEGDAAAKAADYAKRLESILGTPPTFDIILLGMGGDGHTASLFPGSPGLQETEKWAILNPVASMNTERWTVTYPVLNAAREVWFLVSGADKKPMLDRLVARDQELPSARIQNPAQTIYWAQS